MKTLGYLATIRPYPLVFVDSDKITKENILDQRHHLIFINLSWRIFDNSTFCFVKVFL